MLTFIFKCAKPLIKVIFHYLRHDSHVAPPANLLIIVLDNIVSNLLSC